MRSGRAAATIVGEGRRLWRGAADRSTNGLERDYFRGGGRPAAHAHGPGRLVGALIGAAVRSGRRLGCSWAWPGSRRARLGLGGVLPHHFRDHGPRCEIRRPRVGGGDRRGAAADAGVATRGRAKSRAAIECFRTGKSPAYDAELCASSSCARPAACATICWPHSSSCSCARRSPATACRRRRARILMRAAERLGMSRLEFARMEAAVRARHRRRRQRARRPQRPLSGMLCGARGERELRAMRK